MSLLPLPPADLAHVMSAQDCLRAGNHAGAAEAIEKTGPEARTHPDVLEIVWELQANAQQWEEALETARNLASLAPESEFGLMYQACSLNELKRQPEAFDVLLIAAEKFPHIPMIPYNLACCACKLGRRKEATHWLVKASQVGGRAEVKLMALGDPDLGPLLDEICAL